jgi:hypothetical protein
MRLTPGKETYILRFIYIAVPLTKLLVKSMVVLSSLPPRQQPLGLFLLIIVMAKEPEQAGLITIVVSVIFKMPLLHCNGSFSTKLYGATT